MNEPVNNTESRNFLMANIFHSFVARSNSQGISYDSNTMEAMTRLFTQYADSILDLHEEFKDKMVEYGIRLIEDVAYPLGDLLALDAADSADPVLGFDHPRETILEALQLELNANTFNAVFKTDNKNTHRERGIL